MRERKTDWVLDIHASPMSDVLKAHLDGCAACSNEVDEMQRLMRAMDAWQAPEPNAYFMTRFVARLDEARVAEPDGWFHRLYRGMHARLHYGSRWRFQPIAVMALSLLVVVGGGAYITHIQPVREAAPAVITVTPAVLQDLQSLDTNAPALNTLESLSGMDD